MSRRLRKAFMLVGALMGTTLAVALTVPHARAFYYELSASSMSKPEMWRAIVYLRKRGRYRASVRVKLRCMAREPDSWTDDEFLGGGAFREKGELGEARRFCEKGGVLTQRLETLLFFNGDALLVPMWLGKLKAASDPLHVPLLVEDLQFLTGEHLPYPVPWDNLTLCKPPFRPTDLPPLRSLPLYDSAAAEKLREDAVEAWSQWWHENKAKLVRDEFTGLMETKNRLDAEQKGLVALGDDLWLVLDPAFRNARGETQAVGDM